MPPLPAEAAPYTQATRTFGSLGSNTMSRMRAFPLVSGGTLPDAVTLSFWKVGLALVALVERYTLSSDRGGMSKPIDAEGLPDVPVYVDTKMVAGSVGWTRTWLMARPVKAVVPGMPVVTGGSMGPVRFAVVDALSMRYRPTPKKLSAEPLGSPVPT